MNTQIRESQAATSSANVHVFLLVGQSNMAGRDATPFDFPPDSRILNFSDGRAGAALNQIEVANDPLRHDKLGVVHGTNLGRPFARALLATLPQGDKILLVNRAWGGTAIADWHMAHGPSGYLAGSSYDLPVNLYNTAVNDYLAAMRAVRNTGGTALVAGILWLQGESDAGLGTPSETYRAAVNEVLGRMRADLGKTEVPVVIVSFFEGFGAESGARLRETLAQIAEDLGAAFVRADGAAVLADGVHMTTASHQMLGERACNAYLQITRPVPD